MTESLKNLINELFNLFMNNELHSVVNDQKKTSILDKVEDSLEWKESDFTRNISDHLNLGGHRLNRLIHESMGYLAWGGASARIGRMSEKLADQMPMCEIIGPVGLIKDKDLRMGLVLQFPGVIYGPRWHKAKETFFVFSGEGEFWKEGEEVSKKRAGEYINHTSFQKHKSITHEQAVFSAWVWSGSISYETYSVREQILAKSYLK